MAGAGERGEDAAVEEVGADAERVVAVDELHLVYTRFQNMVTQVPSARRMAPLQVEYVDQDEVTGEREHPDDDAEELAPCRTTASPALRVRTERGHAVRRTAAEVHRRPVVRGAAGVGGVGSRPRASGR